MLSPKNKLHNQLLFLALILLCIQINAQEKIKFSIDGTEKIEFKTNAIGDLLLNYFSNGFGSDNLFMGQDAGLNVSHTSGVDGYFNTAIGNYAFTQNTTGYRNTALGSSALFANTVGKYNTALGHQALYRNDLGEDNLAIGINALYENKGISRNIAIGNYALEKANNSTSGGFANNIAIGFHALRGSGNPTDNTGTGNIAIGNLTLEGNTSGFYNTAVGTEVMVSNTTGERNVAIGTGTLGLNTVGNYNTAVGQGAMLRNSAESNNTAIGYGALRNGNNSATPGEGHNTALGFEALRGESSSVPNVGKYNTGIGSSALWSNTIGNSNSALGNFAFYENTEGTGNVGVGYLSGVSNTTGNQNIAIGTSSLYFNQTGNNNVAIGSNAGINAKGSGNVFIGYKAGELEIGTSSNKLYINNSGQTQDSALIYGEFDNNYIRMNANVEAVSFDASKSAVIGKMQFPTAFLFTPAIYGENLSALSSGIGVAGVGEWQGVRGEARTTTNAAYGVGGNATMNNPFNNYGVYGHAQNASHNYSIFGENPGSGVNDWAGYFAGKVYALGNIIVDGEIEASSAGVKFDNGESIKKAVPLKYIICISGFYPSSGSGSASNNDLIGEVKLFAGNFAPQGWAFCEGQIISIISNTALFSILGTTYGGDGINNFALPDLREAVPVGKL